MPSKNACAGVTKVSRNCGRGEAWNARQLGGSWRRAEAGDSLELEGRAKVALERKRSDIVTGNQAERAHI